MTGRSVLRCASALLLAAWAGTAEADGIATWNAKAAVFVKAQPLPAPMAARNMLMVHVAMFDALNSISPRYRPYVGQLPAAGTESMDAAAAAAAAGVLVGLNPRMQQDVRTDLARFVATLAPGEATDAGIKLGEASAAAVLAARAKDGANAPNAYRPTTPPGVYVPTATVILPHWSAVTPFALTSARQFRPAPPPALDDPQWAAELKEVRDYGGRESIVRSLRQTEDAWLWIQAVDVYDEVPVQLAEAHNLEGVDKARFLALAAGARFDASIAAFEAKYHYGFWRPVTAVRHAAEADAAWQPIDATPLHPEYPCLHCISAGAVTAVAEAVFGAADVPEFSVSNPVTPGVTHRWVNLRAFADEISESRIWAGFHYRFSIRAGQEMGRKVGAHVVETVMQPVAQAVSRQ